MPRNTAAAIGLAASYAENRFAEPTLAVLPTDHKIEGDGAFAMQLRAGEMLAKNDAIVLFGIPPLSASSQYGYVVHSEEGYAVTAFHEKPGPAMAKALIATGRAYWNSGMFVMRAATCLRELRTHAPDIFLKSREAALSLEGTVSGWYQAKAECYNTMPALPIDKAVMEKRSRLLVLPFAPRWADLGTWNEVERVTGEGRIKKTAP
jgi:mannose-1-phosphate guanylyltransferase